MNWVRRENIFLTESRGEMFENHQTGPVFQFGDQGLERLSAEPGQEYATTKE